MIVHNIKTGFRHLIRNWSSTVINVVGLGLGIACCLIIFLYVHHELNYDKYIPDGDRIYRAYIVFPNNGGIRSNFPHLSYPAICENIPDLENYTLTYPYGVQVVHGENVFKESQFAYTDSSLFKIFGWKIKSGDPNKLLVRPNDIVISEKAAYKYFGDQDPIGKTLRLDNRVDYIVSGVFEDIPEQSHIQGDYFVNISTCPMLHPQYNSWIVGGSYIYVKLKKNTNKEDAERKFTQNWQTINSNRSQSLQQTSIKLQPLSDIYMNADQIGGPSQFKFGSSTSIIIFSVIGLLILLVACFNYLNLTFAKIYVRWVETGIRKTNGANKVRIVGQFITESSISVLAALVIGVILSSLMLPVVNLIIGKNLVLFSVWLTVLGFMAVLFIFIVLSTAIYPSLALANLNPVDIINGRIYNTSKQNNIRDWFITRIRGILISFQFVIVIVICICTIVIIKQIWYTTHIDFGFEKENVLVMKNPWDENQKSRYQIMTKLASEIPGVEIVTGGYDVPMQGTRNFCGMYNVNDPDNPIGAGMASIDYDYLPLLGVKFIAGRNFSPQYSTDSLAVIITEDAVERLRLKKPIGAVVSGLWDNRKRHVVGVVNNIVFNDTYSGRFPMVFECRQIRRPYYNKIILKTTDIKTVNNKLHEIWKREFPDMAYISYSLDEMMDQNHLGDVRLQNLMYIFTGLSFVLCIMGLLGVVTIYIRRRTKEIGIRKTNGAKISEIITILNKDFVIWITIAFIIATPTAWYFSNKWLQNFSYKTELSWWIFAIGGIAALIITLITVSLQSMNTARINPAKALRYE